MSRSGRLSESSTPPCRCAGGGRDVLTEKSLMIAKTFLFFRTSSVGVDARRKTEENGFADRLSRLGG